MGELLSNAIIRALGYSVNARNRLWQSLQQHPLFSFRPDGDPQKA